MNRLRQRLNRLESQIFLPQQAYAYQDEANETAWHEFAKLSATIEAAVQGGKLAWSQETLADFNREIEGNQGLLRRMKPGKCELGQTIGQLRIFSTTFLEHLADVGRQFGLLNRIEERS